MSQGRTTHWAAHRTARISQVTVRRPGESHPVGFPSPGFWQARGCLASLRAYPPPYVTDSASRPGPHLPVGRRARPVGRSVHPPLPGSSPAGRRPPYAWTARQVAAVRALSARGRPPEPSLRPKGRGTRQPSGPCQPGDDPATPACAYSTPRGSRWPRSRAVTQLRLGPLAGNRGQGFWRLSGSQGEPPAVTGRARVPRRVRPAPGQACVRACSATTSTRRRPD